MGKLVINCSTKKVDKIPFTPEEIEQNELEQQRQEEQELLDTLKPSEKEVLMAEIELNTINLLIESGVI